MATWQDSKANLEELVALLKEDDSEQKAIEDLTTAISDLGATFETGFGDVRTAIRALGRRVESAEHAASNTGDLRLLDSAIRDEQQQREKALHILKEIMDAKDSAKDRAESLRQAAASAHEASRRAIAAREAALPRLKHSMSLFAAASHIRFDIDAPGGHIKGVVAPPSGSEGAGPLAFDLQPSSEGLSEVDVADRLWDLVGAATGVGAQ